MERDGDVRFQVCPSSSFNLISCSKPYFLRASVTFVVISCCSATNVSHNKHHALNHLGYSYCLALYPPQCLKLNSCKLTRALEFKVLFNSVSNFLMLVIPPPPSTGRRHFCQARKSLGSPKLHYIFCNCLKILQQ